MRRGAFAALLLLAGCERAPETTPTAVRIDARDADVERIDRAARACGAVRTVLIERNGRETFIVGRSNSPRARACFEAWARADYRDRHPVRGAIGL